MSNDWLTDEQSTLGFRPENLTTDSSHPKLVDSIVDVVEQMGHETIAYLTVGADSIVARLDTKFRIEPGAKISIGEPLHVI